MWGLSRKILKCAIQFVWQVISRGTVRSSELKATCMYCRPTSTTAFSTSPFYYPAPALSVSFSFHRQIPDSQHRR